MFQREEDRCAHRLDTARVNSAGDIRGCDAPHQGRILAALLSYVSVEVDIRHCCDPDTLVILATFLRPSRSQIHQFSREIVRHARCPMAGPSACGLRQGAVNAGGSQVGYQDEGAFGRPIRFNHPPLLRSNYIPNSYTPAPSGYSSANLSSLASVSTVVPLRFQAPSVSNRRSPIRRPHGAMTRPIAR
jgi:hypothetical protein